VSTRARANSRPLHAQALPAHPLGRIIDITDERRPGFRGPQSNRSAPGDRVSFKADEDHGSAAPTPMGLLALSEVVDGNHVTASCHENGNNGDYAAEPTRSA
jgi:hypothetical protein